MSGESKDKWDKVAVILTPVGGLLTALAVAWIGYTLNMRQAEESNLRFYADIMSKREEADTNLRKDMFNAAIRTFVESKPVTLEKEVLDLELLAYNFHESIDLGPLFKDVYRRVLDPQTPAKDREKYRAQVEKLAQEVIDKEIESLEVEGKLDADVFFDDIKPEGLKVIDQPLPEPQAWPGKQPPNTPPSRNFRVTVLGINPDRREMRVELEVRTPHAGNASTPGTKEALFVHSVFRVGFSDFPMIDNTRLSDGYRCAIVLRKFEEQGAKITLVYFPTSRAALKDKPYYDEMLDDLLRARERHSNAFGPQP